MYSLVPLLLFDPATFSNSSIPPFGICHCVRRPGIPKQYRRRHLSWDGRKEGTWCTRVNNHINRWNPLSLPSPPRRRRKRKKAFIFYGKKNGREQQQQQQHHGFRQEVDRRQQAQSCWVPLAERCHGLLRLQLVPARHENQCQDHPCQAPCSGSYPRCTSWSCCC